jgi:hypothetical protein
MRRNLTKGQQVNSTVSVGFSATQGGEADHRRCAEGGGRAAYQSPALCPAYVRQYKLLRYMPEIERGEALGKLLSFAAVASLALLSAGCTNSNEYEVIERSQKEVPNFQRAGTHTEVAYVLLNGGHKFYATCDASDVDNLDPTSTCGFRPLRKYECRLGGQAGDKALSDLLCKDADGHNVYLYVNKKD